MNDMKILAKFDVFTRVKKAAPASEKYFEIHESFVGKALDPGATLQ